VAQRRIIEPRAHDPAQRGKLLGLGAFGRLVVEATRRARKARQHKTFAHPPPSQYEHQFGPIAFPGLPQPLPFGLTVDNVIVPAIRPTIAR
jgi:hypothetical protein